jgi:hypothetical protein
MSAHQILGEDWLTEMIYQHVNNWDGFGSTIYVALRHVHIHNFSRRVTDY